MGDSNVRYAGEWHMTEGRAWLKWQLAALRARRDCARLHGDEVTARRVERQIAQTERELGTAAGRTVRKAGG